MGCNVSSFSMGGYDNLGTFKNNTVTYTDFYNALTINPYKFYIIRIGNQTQFISWVFTPEMLAELSVNNAQLGIAGNVGSYILNASGTMGFAHNNSSRDATVYGYY